MTAELVKIEGRELFCVCDKSTPFSQITESDLLKVAPRLKPQVSELILSSGEHSRFTFMRECTVALEFRGNVLPESNVLPEKKKLVWKVGQY